MFDKLIVSEPETANFRNRRSYFIASTVAVGILFLTAVIISIYAADYHLGAGSFEIAELVAPVEMAAPAPEQPQPVKQLKTEATSQKVVDTTRRVLQATTDMPTKVPNTVSTVKNEYLSIPKGPMKIGNEDRNATPAVDRGSGNNSGTLATGGDTGGTVARVDPLPEPPPVKKPDPPKKDVVVSGGVVNGKATSLPTPAYSAAAKSVHATGRVTVQVLIDESGKVVSASALDGHPLLRNSAVAAAYKARFSPTMLTGQPVKVTGMIVYNFNLG